MMMMVKMRLQMVLLLCSPLLVGYSCCVRLSELCRSEACECKLIDMKYWSLQVLKALVSLFLSLCLPSFLSMSDCGWGFNSASILHLPYLPHPTLPLLALARWEEFRLALTHTQPHHTTLHYGTTKSENIPSQHTIRKTTQHGIPSWRRMRMMASHP